jgi:hypothetical protein
MLLNLLDSGKFHQGNIRWCSMQHSSALYHLGVSVPAISKGNNTSTWLILSKHYRACSLLCQLLAPRTIKIDVPDAVRGELVEP